MKRLAVLGLGHIGSYVLEQLQAAGVAEVHGFDLSNGYDLSDNSVLETIIPHCDGVLASTPFFLNKQIATVCAKHAVDYFDLTESVEVTDYVKNLGTSSKFITQCGLAPGMVSVIANHLASRFDSVEEIAVRVGALPKSAKNHLKYYRTWNTEGLINEYIHPCPAIRDGRMVELAPLEDREQVCVNGMNFEAANTSGGIGSLAEIWLGRAGNVNYKTLRYPGHWDHIKFLANDLGLKNNFDTYVKLFNENVPVCSDDVVYILIQVSGQRGGAYTTESYSNTIGRDGSSTAIQIATGNGVLCVIDAWLQGHLDHMTGWIAQEHLPASEIFSSLWFTPY